jgi:bifunctional NMN adenylyltransferase/nudix hydrolase
MSSTPVSQAPAESFDLLVMIGRFEPLHNGHASVLRHARTLSRRLAILIGSAEQARTTKNPWNFDERRVMIEAVLGDEAMDTTDILPLRDHPYDENAWLIEVQGHVGAICKRHNLDPKTARIGLIGREKDQSSYYLHSFPQWTVIDVQHTAVLSATELRDQFFSEDEGARLLLKANLPREVFAFMEAFRQHGPAYRDLVEEWTFMNRYREAWKAAPYAPTFVTVDGIIECAGHVLLVRRRANPGKGLWALPGGFVNQNETLLQAVRREVREETRLRLERDNPLSVHVFDAPSRSLRGRTITHAFHFKLPDGPLPKNIRGADDADKAMWVPLETAKAMREHFFEDHHAILEHFLF